jgi:hypothetical protein
VLRSPSFANGFAIDEPSGCCAHRIVEHHAKLLNRLAVLATLEPCGDVFVSDRA